MTDYRPYPQYKPSNVDWLGDVPTHWDVIRIKHLTPVKRGASPRPIDDPKYFDDDGEFAWVRIADVSASERYLEQTTQRLSEVGENLSVKRLPGDLFLSIAGTVGKPIITKIKCCIHDGFVYFPEFKQNNEFLYYVFACGQPYLGLGKMGTQLNLNTDTVGSILIGLPPELEQDEIVRFLDFKTAQIDALIAKKQALLAKLAEKRTALISHAVTKGLDPSVPIKDSGVAWLGKIPTHWTVKRTKFSVSYIGSGKTPKGGSEVYVQEGIMILRSQNVHDKGLRLDDVAYITDEADAAQSATRVLAGDVLLNITGASIGRTSIVPTPFPQANVNQHVCILRPIRNLLTSEYLHLLLCSRQAKDQISALENGTSREGLNFPQVGGLLFAFPPVREQVEIVAAISTMVEAIDLQCEKVLSVIGLLVEYRSALITNAVTGKIDVRDFVVPANAGIQNTLESVSVSDSRPRSGREQALHGNDERKSGIEDRGHGNDGLLMEPVLA